MTDITQMILFQYRFLGAISWCSKKQTSIALLSCEAEYVAAPMATQECTWLERPRGEFFF